MTFDFMNCSHCKQLMEFPNPHPDISNHFNWNLKKKAQTEKLALVRAKHEGIDKDERLNNPDDDNFYNNLQQLAMYKLAYYLCYKCKNPYFGGKKDCANVEEQKFDEKELVCGKCAADALGVGEANCRKHGIEFIEFKCKFCCKIAQWFCWGNTHFCDECHSKQCAGDYVARYHPSQLPQCSGADKCPLKIKHPPNGHEYPLGCSVCKNMAALNGQQKF